MEYDNKDIFDAIDLFIDQSIPANSISMEEEHPPMKTLTEEKETSSPNLPNYFTFEETNLSSQKKATKGYLSDPKLVHRCKKELVSHTESIRNIVEKNLDAKPKVIIN